MVSQSVSLGVEHYLGFMTRYLLLSDSYGLVLWDALSDERTVLSFVYAAGPRQRIHSRVRVPWDSWPYLAVSDLSLPSLSLPATRRFTVEVLHSASTRVCTHSLQRLLSLYNPSAWTMKETQVLCCWEGLFTDLLPSNGRPIVACVRFQRNVFTESSPIMDLYVTIVSGYLVTLCLSALCNRWWWDGW
jgi:hypothetical protein